MSIGKTAALYAICAVAFFALDFVWLSLSTSRLYRPLLGDLMTEQPRVGIAAMFYLAYVVGIIALASLPGLREGSVLVALWRGALFGLLAYATYDLTNLSTIRDWPWQVSVVDMIWGTTVTGIVATVGYFVASWLGI